MIRCVQLAFALLRSDKSWKALLYVGGAAAKHLKKPHLTETGRMEKRVQSFIKELTDETYPSWKYILTSMA